jgi:hypothetical protein
MHGLYVTLSREQYRPDDENRGNFEVWFLKTGMMDRVQKDTFKQCITPLSKILNLILFAFSWFLLALP